MTAYVVTADCNLRDIGNAAKWGVVTARTGGDTIDTNGFTVVIDQDTRYGLSGTTSTSLGNMTINATKGGNLTIDGTKVWLVPFSTGSGTITASAAITLSAATCNVIGIYSAITVAPVLTGVATGWIKVTNTVGTLPSSGTFTQAGYTFTITGPSIQGFIEVVGDEASTINANRLGTVSILGAWYDLGAASGSSVTTYQLPTNGAIQYYPAIWVETASGSGVYEAYVCAGSLLVAASTPTDARGKLFWVTTAGVLRFGSDGTNTVGYVPPVGCKIRMPNVLLVNCTVAARTANVLPNATLATRYDFTTTGGGVIVMDKVTCCWYPSFAQAYSTTLSYVGVAEQLSVSEIAQPLNWDNIAVGQLAALAQVALIMSLCFAGGTISNGVWTRATQGAGLSIRTITDSAGFTFTNNRWFSLVLRSGAASVSTDTRLANSTFSNDTCMGQISLVTCSNITFTNTIYYDCITTTQTANPNSVWSLATGCSNIKLSGLTFGGFVNVQPYNSILAISAAGCSTIKLRNIGTYAAPLSFGSVNACGLVYSLSSNAAASDVKIQRVYISLARTGVMTGDNSSTRVTEENVFGDYASAVDVGAVLNYSRKSRGGTIAVTAQTAIYGTHWYDSHISTTTGRIGFMMNETTSLTTSQVTLTGGSAFTSTGSLYMPTIGMTATFELPYYLIGHTAFQNSAAIMAGGTATNYTYGFQIDKNDGAGWSVLTSGSTAITLATALNALTLIDAAKGFKLRIKITTSTTNTTAITSFYLLTSSTTTSQAYQYPLDTISLTLTGLKPGSDIVVLVTGTSTERSNIDANATTSWAYVYSTQESVDIGVFKVGFVPFYIRNYSLSAADASLPIAQVVDRNYA